MRLLAIYSLFSYINFMGIGIVRSYDEFSRFPSKSPSTPVWSDFGSSSATALLSSPTKSRLASGQNLVKDRILVRVGFGSGNDSKPDIFQPEDRYLNQSSPALLFPNSLSCFPYKFSPVLECLITCLHSTTFVSNLSHHGK
jgi:hypothetical protein